MKKNKLNEAELFLLENGCSNVPLNDDQGVELKDWVFVSDIMMKFREKILLSIVDDSNKIKMEK